jgi:hypothetical protein
MGKIEEVKLRSYFSYKKYLLFGVIVLVVLILIIFLPGFFRKEQIVQIPICGDSSFYNTCSLIKPYYCSNGTLVQNSSVCGCNGLKKENDSCSSKYFTNATKIQLTYFLIKENKIDFTVYGGAENYLSNVPRAISYFGEERPSRVDFTLANINEDQQREFILPLVINIENLAKNKDDQARIAVSLVQNIPFGGSGKTFKFSGQEINYSRYAYEVLYDQKGVCGEKSELLALLLKELGYGLVLFYYPEENHEAIGIKCPLEKSVLKSGYCFIETSGPSIITDDKMEYQGGITLSSIPEIFLISEGLTFGENNFYEYNDAIEMEKVYGDMRKDGKINFFKSAKLIKLREKYGLGGIYEI